MQGRLEGLNLLNMDNVQAMVDRQVENITGVVNKLSSTCTTSCPVQNSPQCKPTFTEISLVAFSILLFRSLQYFSILSDTVLCKPSPSSQPFTINVFSFDQKPLSLCYLYSILFYPSYFKRFLFSSHLSWISFFAVFMIKKSFLSFFLFYLNSPQMLLW